jgi:hypothetical protein
MVLITLLAINIVFSACSPDETNHFFGNESEPTDWDNLSVFRECLVEQEQIALDELEGLSRYDINLTVGGDYLSIKGSQRVQYTNNENDLLESIFFYLYPNIVEGRMVVSNITIDDKEITPEFLFEGTVMQVTLDRPLEIEDQVVLEMEYEIQLTAEIIQPNSLIGYVNGILLLDSFYPVIPAYDDRGWNVSYPPRGGDKTFLDVSYYQVDVAAPEGMVLVTSGVETDRRIEGNYQVVSFVAGPSRDFYVVGSDYFKVVSTSVGQVEINSYYSGDIVEEADMALDHAVGALEIFGRRLGSYPYTELDVVSLPLPAGILGIEYPGVIGVDLDAFTLGVTLEAVVAHEVGHQWFYAVVGNDQVIEPWLDEALVQYITGLYFLDKYGDNGWEGVRDSWINRWNRVEQKPIPVGMPTDFYGLGEYSAIVYGRGPLFVEAMANTMSQQVFDLFLLEYYNSSKWGIATANDFRRIAKETCKCELEVLFNDWL